VSERAFFSVKRGGQFTKRQECRYFAPVGLYLVTRDNIAVMCRTFHLVRVNVKMRQQGTTATCVWREKRLSATQSVLYPVSSDVIFPGNSAGVRRWQWCLPQYLQPRYVCACRNRRLESTATKLIADRLVILACLPSRALQNVTERGT